MKSKMTIAAAMFVTAIALSNQIATAQQHHGPGAGNRMQGQQAPGGMTMPGMMGGGMMMPGMMGRGMMGGGMMGGGCPMMGGEEDTFIKGRIAFLKAELGITAEQENAFNAYTEALNENFESMHGMRESMMGMMSAESPVERLNIHLTMMESRLTALKAVKPKLEMLYAQLSDAQKSKADRLLTGMGCMM